MCVCVTGCQFGYQPGGWGKPPVDEYGNPVYGDVFGVAEEEVESDTEVDKVRTHAHTHTHAPSLSSVMLLQYPPFPDTYAHIGVAGWRAIHGRGVHWCVHVCVCVSMCVCVDV